MTLIVDAGPLVIHANGNDARFASVVVSLDEEPGKLVTSLSVATEADFLILQGLGVRAELAFLRDLARGAFIVDCLSREELELARETASQYRDLKLGLADASLVVLAYRYGTDRILTFDERAFRTVRPLQGGSFTLLPADR